ncbi:MAG: ARMT1-like domain-containing protein [Thermodesulfobacteriota bacterium]
MRTSPDCLACFLRQAEYSADLATDSLPLRTAIMDKAANLIPTFALELSPPENSVSLYRMIAEMSDHTDIFSDLKKRSNRAALGMLPYLEDKLKFSETPLLTAARLAIAGNIIDYGSHQDFDVQKAIDECLTNELAINHLEEFQKKLRTAQKILYLADNCGELVFDRLLIEYIGKPVTLAVKEKPIINDALRKDAEYCGLDLSCRIISNGTDCPGTPLQNCSREFRREFEAADLIISKGQGNFETLSEIDAPIFFMLMVKCPVVANHVAEIADRPKDTIINGDLVLMEHNRGNLIK